MFQFSSGGLCFNHSSPGMTALNQQFVSFAKVVEQLLYNLLPPSVFGKPEVWSSVQVYSPILCLRPGSARGLPMCTHATWRLSQIPT